MVKIETKIVGTDQKMIITMTRGDTLRAVVHIYNQDGTEYIPVEGDKVRFAVKQHYNDEEVLINKDVPIDTMILEVQPEDTKSLIQPQRYHFDIQLTKADGFTYTFIYKGILKISEEVE